MPLANRKRAKVSPVAAPVGTAKESEFVPVASGSLVKTCSPASDQLPLPLKSTQAFSSPAAEAVTSRVTVSPAATTEVKTTPSSSSPSGSVSSPSALAVGWPSASASTAAPRKSAPIWCRAPLLTSSV